MKIPFVLMFVCLFLNAGTQKCEEDKPVNDDPATTQTDIAKLEYRFGDSSVPPQYHRSYTITVDRETASVVVDSYGDTLATKSYDITPEQFTGAIEAFKTSGLRSCRGKENDGCTGGTTEYVDVYGPSTGSGTFEFSGHVYHCGGQDSGNMCGDVKVYADYMTGLIPDLKKLTE